MNNTSTHTNTKNYWEKAQREFKHITIFLIIIYVLSFFVWLSNVEFAGPLSISNDFYSVAATILSIFYLVGWFVLAHLFKINDKRAIWFGYFMQGALTVYIVVEANELIHFLPLLIPAYFTWVIYKASQSGLIHKDVNF